MRKPGPLQALLAHKTWLLGAVVCGFAALFFLLTLQKDINGLEDLVDTGEFQNALFLWGIVHPTGYPLYLLGGGVFVHLLNWVGVNPAEGASLFSLVGAVAALGLLFVSLVKLTGHALVAGASTLVVAAMGAFWLRGIDAEVYSWAFFFVALALYIALLFRENPRPRTLVALAFVLGMGAAHHRLVGLLGPALLLWIAPEAWRLVRERPRVALLAVAALVLPFAIYAYLPLRAYLGTKWEFAAADTWNGFWELVSGRGYLNEGLEPPSNLSAFLTGAGAAIQLLAQQLTWVGLAVSSMLVLLLWTWRRTRRLAGLVSVGVAAYFFFAIIYPIHDIDAYLVPAEILLVLASAVALAQAGARWNALRAVIWLPLLGWAIWLGVQTYPLAHGVGTDRSGRELLDAASSLAGAHSVLVAPWGTDFFVFWYGKYVTGEIAADTIIATPDAPVRQYLGQGLSIYTSKNSLYAFSPDQWNHKLGTTYLSSPAPNMVQLASRPNTTLPPDSQTEATFGKFVSLVKDDVQSNEAQNSLDLTLYWRADRKIPQDYSVMVHLVDRTQGDRIVAQADSRNPVYGFFPTSRWSKGEVVQDRYRLTSPRAVPLARTDVIVGWYSQDKAGKFQDLGTHRINLSR